MEDERPIARLIFVYDADSGILGATIDGLKKLLFLRGCALCAITHGVISERSEWSLCKDDLGVPVDYWHRDETRPQLVRLRDERWPCVIAEVAPEEHVVVLRRDVLERCKGSVSDFRGRLLHHAVRLGLSLPYMRTGER